MNSNTSLKHVVTNKKTLRGKDAKEALEYIWSSYNKYIKNFYPNKRVIMILEDGQEVNGSIHWKIEVWINHRWILKQDITIIWAEDTKVTLSSHYFNKLRIIWVDEVVLFTDHDDVHIKNCGKVSYHNDGWNTRITNCDDVRDGSTDESILNDMLSEYIEKN